MQWWAWTKLVLQHIHHLNNKLIVTSLRISKARGINILQNVIFNLNEVRKLYLLHTKITKEVPFPFSVIVYTISISHERKTLNLGTNAWYMTLYHIT